MEALQVEAGPVHATPCHGLGQFLVKCARIVLDRDVGFIGQIKSHSQVID